MTGPPATTQRARWIDRLALGAVALGAALFAILMCVAAIRRYNAYHAGMYDFGIYNQVAWNTLHGRFFATTIDRVSPNYLGDHFVPGFLLMVIPYAFVPRPETLLVTQSVLLGAAALPIYVFVRDRSASPLLGVGVAGAYLLNPFTQGAAIFDVHELSMLPLIAALLLVVAHRRPGGPAFWVLFAALLLTRDQMAAVGVAFGFYVAFALGRRKLGAALAAVSVVWGVLVFGVFAPASADPVVRAMQFRIRYGHLGNSYGEVLSTLARHPGRGWEELRRAYKFYGRLLIPYAYLPLLSGWAVLLALPGVLAAALSSYTPWTDPSYQYHPIQAAFLALAVGRASRLLRHLPATARTRVAAATGAAVLASGVWAFTSYGFVAGHGKFSPKDRERTVLARAADQVGDLIPPGASLEASNRLGAHHSRRRHIEEFPTAKRPAGYVFIIDPDVMVSSSSRRGGSYARKAAAIAHAAEYRLVAERDGVLLYASRKRDATDDPGFPWFRLVLVAGTLGGAVTLLLSRIRAASPSGPPDPR